MKGNYRRKSTHTSRLRTIGIYTLILVIIVIFLRPVVGGVVSGVHQRVAKVSYWLFDSTGSIPNYFRDKNELLHEIEELESSLAAHSGDRMTIVGLVNENMELRSQLGVDTPKRTQANIIARPPQVAFDALLLDAGASHGVSEGALVYAHEDQVIGVVVRVFNRSSVVKLVTSPQSVATVYIIGPDIYTTAVGIGGGVLQVNVPQGVLLEQGNLVVVPALGAGVYGVVEEVVSVPTEPVQYGFVTTGESLHALRSVAIGATPIEQLSFEETRLLIEESVIPELRIDVPEEFLTEETSPESATSSEEVAESASVANEDIPNDE